MDHVSRPLIALLVGTVAFFALWLVALKPSSSGGGSSPGVYASPIAKAHQAVAVSAAASVAHGDTVVPSARPSAASAAVHTPATATQPAISTLAPPTAPAKAVPRVRPARPPAAMRRASSVAQAIQAHKTLALLFYNAAGADDRAVRQELAAVPAHGGKVLRLAVPLNELARYAAVTNQVTVNASPTLIVIDGAHHASTIVGFADRFEIAQLVADALAAS
ncbi:MAG: hypothetical protein ACR2JH_05055 [Solirubrobacteraceae bacterium]